MCTLQRCDTGDGEEGVRDLARGPQSQEHLHQHLRWYVCFDDQLVTISSFCPSGMCRYHALRLHRRGCHQSHQGAPARDPSRRSSEGYEGGRGQGVRPSRFPSPSPVECVLTFSSLLFVTFLRQDDPSIRTQDHPLRQPGRRSRTCRPARARLILLLPVPSLHPSPAPTIFPVSH